MPVATKKLRSNRAWIERHINDPFVKRSKAEGYRARSVYKLTELDDREHLLRRGMTVVDLGAAPGSWTQIVRERLVGRDGKVDGRIIAMDILPMDPIDGVTFLQGDFREQEVADKLAEILGGDKVDVVLSDMAPNLSGIAAADAAPFERARPRILPGTLEAQRRLRHEGLPGFGLFAVRRGAQEAFPPRLHAQARGFARHVGGGVFGRPRKKSVIVPPFRHICTRRKTLSCTSPAKKPLSFRGGAAVKR